ncbi:MAG TPA: DUF4870 domain-containing protein [Anaerolineales bacterium]|jgi:uncharacterized membrane protein
MTDFNAEVTSDDKLWSALTYVFSPIVPIILMLMEDKKNRPFIKSHNVQALVLGILNIVVSSVLTFAFIGPCIGLAVWLYMVYLGYQAYQGKNVVVPVVTNFVKSQGWA